MKIPFIGVERTRAVLPALLFAAAVVFYCLLTLPLQPFGDDWHYHTIPNLRFTWKALLPGSAVWRPLDILFGGLLGLAPALFPAANHCLVVFGHVLGAYALWRLCLGWLGLRDREAALTTAFFLFATGVFPAVASIDSPGQVYASTFGILGWHCFLRFRAHGRWRWYAGYALLCLLATFAKENGIVWFLAIPCLSAGAQPSASSSEKNGSSGWRVLAGGAVLCASYFAIRFALAGSLRLGAAEGAYRISFTSAMLGKLLAMTFGSIAFIDTVAIFSRPPAYFLVALTVLLSLPFFAWMVVSSAGVLRQEALRVPFFKTLAVTGIMMVPNAVTTAGEMHLYALGIWVALIVGFLLKADEPGGRRAMTVAWLAALLSIMVVNGHKWVRLRAMGRGTGIVTGAIAAAYQGKPPPQRVLIIKVADAVKGYSLYSQPAAQSAYYGYAARAIWKWRHPVEIDSVWVRAGGQSEAIADTLAREERYDAFWVVHASGSCEVIQSSR